jgi:tripartite-type tricarboxylate transporter receptor subunit TctC
MPRHLPKNELENRELDEVFKMIRSFVAILAFALGVSAAIAQEAYPSRNVTIIVPLAAGSGTDIMARVLATSLSAKFGKSFTVENRPGAAGVTGAEYTARQPNDGYTLMFGGNGTHSAGPHLSKSIKYDPIKDFTPISRLAGAGAVLLVHPDSPYKSVADIIRDAKAQPGKLTYGAPNSGSQIASETIKKVMGVDITRVPYRATPQAMTDVIGGTITMAFVDVAGALANVTSGKARALIITSGKRSALLPDIPTMQETGFKDFDLSYWTGLFGPQVCQRMWWRSLIALTPRSWARGRCRTRCAHSASIRYTCRRRRCRPT